MTDKKLLKEIIKDSGMTMVAIARKSNMKRPTLYYKINNDDAEFTGTEISALSKTLGLSKAQRDYIFLQ